MRRALLIIFGVLLVGAVVFAAGPRIRVDLSRDYTPPRPLPKGLDGLEAALASHENGDVVDGAEKRLLWHDGTQPTEIALVYLHGFSASRQETAPLVERLAKRLGANAFEARLAGHGLTNDGLGEATATDWLEDVAEALEVARRIGEKTVIVGVSTGATLATLATQLWPDEIAAMVLISPNYGVNDPFAGILEWPWIHLLLPKLIPTRSWEPLNDLEEKYWTTQYRSEVLFQMQAVVRAARAVPYESMRTPALVLANPADDVVSFEKTKALLARWPESQRKVIEVSVPKGRPTHVLAGDIQNPETTDPMVSFAERFINDRLYPLARGEKHTGPRPLEDWEKELQEHLKHDH